MTRTLRLSRLYRQELRALPRARFALAGVAILAAALTALAMVVIPSPLGLWSFALLVYGAGPVVLGAFSALQMAGLRANRLDQSLFTLPVASRTVLAAHLLVGLTLSAFYLVATVPFLAVTAYHIAVPTAVLRLLLGGGVLLVFAVVLGTLLGVLFTGRSVAAPVSLTVGFLFLALLAIPPAASMQLDGAAEGSLVMRMLHMSPYVLVSDGLGLLEPSVAAAAVAPLVALVLVAAQILFMLVIAFWVFVREQGPERWESSGARKMAVVVCTTLVLLVSPVVVAGDDYVATEAAPTDRYGSSSHTRGAWIALVDRGAEGSETAFGEGHAGTSEDPLAAGRDNARDLLVRLPVASTSGLRDVTIILETDAHLRIEPTSVVLRTVPDAERDGRGAILRVPVVLTPLDPQDLASNVYQLGANVTYRVAGNDTYQRGEALAALEAEIPWAVVQLGVAGAPLVLVSSIGAVSRRLRVG